ncbi:MAG TPA: hypothetical protein VNH46_00830, partial [Gemmatimonadales bacterium]|nr:hypothetical protein [Gemmatimonadales bacterium]
MEASQPPELSRTKRFVFAVILAIGVPLVAIALIEGFASLGLLVWDVAHSHQVPLAERLHTRYDTLLGWVNRPDVSLPDMYGPGIGLTTNPQGFRGSQPVTPTVPPGQRRIVCSGDSFTLGYGVADDRTWCARLGQLLPGVEAVNMGQGGYGIGQAYLWYARDGAFEHQLQLFAFIYNDLDRMVADQFLGYPKPVLRLQDGSLAVANVPVPRQTRFRRFLHNVATRVRELRLGEGLRRLASGTERPRSVRQDSLHWQVAEAVFDRLARLDRRRGSGLVLVYLPARPDLQPSRLDNRRRWLAQYAARTGVRAIDLTPELRALPAQAADSLFL